MYKLIFADDEILVRENLSRIIDWESAGFKLLCCCSNGHELLEMVESDQPDLVITDINMPFISGIEATKQIKAEYNHIKIVLLTGYDEFEYAQEAIDLKVNKYILKPVTASKLTGILGEMKAELDAEFANSADIAKLKQFYNEYGQTFQPYGESDDHHELSYSYISAAKKYISENYSDPKLSAQGVSESINLSTSHFRSILCKETGMPFVKYLTQFRLEKSKYLIRYSNKKIFEIADETGFSSPQYFSYCFKRYYNMSPADMRAQGDGSVGTQGDGSAVSFLSDSTNTNPG
jgi:two-component system response regulator YesN